MASRRSRAVHGRGQAALFAVSVAWLLATVSPVRAGDDSTRACVSNAESGQQLLKGGKPLAATQLLLQCSQPGCPGVVRRDCLSFLSAAQTATPSIVIGVQDAEGHDVTDASVLLDDVAVDSALTGQMTAVEPGAHKVRFEKPGYAPVLRAFIAREGEKGRPIVAQFAPPLRPSAAVPERAEHGPTNGRPIPALTYGLGAAVLVSAGLFTAFGVRGLSLRRSCGESHTCSPSTYDDVQTSFDVADVSLAVGVVALVGAVWSYVARPEAHGPRVNLDVSAHGGNVRVGLTF